MAVARVSGEKRGGCGENGDRSVSMGGSMGLGLGFFFLFFSID